MPGRHALEVVSALTTTMARKVTCYLRTQRREWGLTQKELGRLMPGGSRRRVSLVERELTPPKASELVAYMLLFGTPPPEIFPGYVAKIVDGVLRRAAELSKRMQDDASAEAVRKHELLRELPARPL